MGQLISRQEGHFLPRLLADGKTQSFGPQSGRAFWHEASGVDAFGQPEQALLARVAERCHDHILAVAQHTPVPPEFLAALTANESGGIPETLRFEPFVFQHLKEVAGGKSPVYKGNRSPQLGADATGMRPPRAAGFHARYLTQPFGANNRQTISRLNDKELSELACSWGFTQIMGYHLVSRGAPVQDLLEPHFHYRLAVEILTDFAACYHLDLGYEVEEMFRCWNTGRPYGTTSDPDYVESGVRRMGLYSKMVLRRRIQTQGPSARGDA